MKVLTICAMTMLLLMLPSAAQSQGPESQGPVTTQSNTETTIRLKAATFDPVTAGEPLVARHFNTPQSPYYLIQFEDTIQDTWLNQLNALGVEFLSYVPDNAMLARLKSDDIEKVRQMYAVRWVGAYQTGYKIAPQLSNRAALPGTVDLYLLAFKGESLSQLSTFLTELGATIHDAADTDIGVTFRVTVANNLLVNIAENPAFAWVEPYTPLSVDNAEARKIMNTENIWANNGYFGAGQIVAISDSGLSVDGALNADFTGRLVRGFAPSEMNLVGTVCENKTTWTDLNGHGTHVAGSVLGSGQNSGSNPAAKNYVNSNAGNAPEAEMIFMAIGLTGGGSLECISTNGSFISLGYENGARISTNSWGGGESGNYDLLSSIVDNYIWSNKDYLVHFAAGNSGPGAGTIGSPGSAKNILSVGASENNRPGEGGISDNPDTMASFSSRGPTADGRIKPDIVAPGTNILSVWAAQAQGLTPVSPGVPYAFSSGTSMATPLTAGASAIVREWLAKARNIANPSAALMKGLMIHGAFQLPDSATPNPNSGWGRVDLKNTLNGQYVLFDDHVSGLTTNGEQTYTIEVVGSNRNALLLRGPASRPEGNAINGFTLLPMASTSKATVVEPSLDGLQGQAVAGFDQPVENVAKIQTGADKVGLPPTTGLAIAREPGRIATAENLRVVAASENEIVETQGTPISVIGGGDFENPGWLDIWNEVWLGFGIPVRTDNEVDVLEGNYSMWLGGTPIRDSVWYPLTFPDTFDNQFESELTFSMRMRNFDEGFDEFCFTFTDVAGFPMAEQFCTDNNFNFGEGTIVDITLTLEDEDKANLAGKAGYLVFYINGDERLPHMSTFIDEIEFYIDYPNATLSSVPSSGPPGTTFLINGTNNDPYSLVSICQTSCDVNLLTTVYADAQGDIQAYIYSTEATTPGAKIIVSEDRLSRQAATTIQITGDSNPALTANPTAGPAGTQFALSGTDFLPNDEEVDIQVNGQSLGTTGSDAQGNIAFTLRTTSNTPAGQYTVTVTDSANRTASTTLEVTEVPQGNPTMTVSPLSGVAGSSFTFTGSNFSQNAAVQFSLDGQDLGQATTDGSGGFVVTLNTQSTIPAGDYTLVATEGANTASASFTITGDNGGGDPPPSGNGLYITLVWTDPPAQANVASTLVNDLDLRLEGPGGPYLGNGGTSRDTVNNVETIRLENPTAGQYTVRVTASRVNPTFGSQPYAILATTSQNFGANTASANITDPGNDVYLPLVTK